MMDLPTPMSLIDEMATRAEAMIWVRMAALALTNFALESGEVPAPVGDVNGY